jgi:hypothetical protein
MAEGTGIEIPIIFNSDLASAITQWNGFATKIENAFVDLATELDKTFLQITNNFYNAFSEKLSKIKLEVADIADAMPFTFSTPTSTNPGVNVPPIPTVNIPTSYSNAYTQNIPTISGTSTTVLNNTAAATDKVTASQNTLNEAVDKGTEATKKSASTTKTASTSAIEQNGKVISTLKQIGIMTIGIGSAAMIARKGIQFLKDSLSAFAEIEDKLGIISDTLAGLGATDTQISKNKELAKSLALATGFKVEDIATTMTSLTVKTGDASVGMKALEVSMNLARARGLSLAQSSNMVYQAMMGQKRSMNQLGVGYMSAQKGSDTLKNQMNILDAAARKVNGTLAAVADDFETSGMRLSSSSELMKASVGQSLSGMKTNMNEFGSGFNGVLVTVFNEITKSLSGNSVNWRQYGGIIGAVFGGIIEVVKGSVGGIIATITMLTSHIINTITWIVKMMDLIGKVGTMSPKAMAAAATEINKSTESIKNQINKDWEKDITLDASLITTGWEKIKDPAKAVEDSIKSQADLFKELQANAKGVVDQVTLDAIAAADAAAAAKKQLAAVKEMKAITFEGIDAGPFMKFIGGITHGNMAGMASSITNRNTATTTTKSQINISVQVNGNTSAADKNDLKKTIVNTFNDIMAKNGLSSQPYVVQVS